MEEYLFLNVAIDIVFEFLFLLLLNLKIFL